MSNELLTIIGTLLAFLLSINGWLFKNMVNNLNDIKLTLVKLTSEHDSNHILVQKHDNEIDKLKERVHTLEGSVPTVLEFIRHIERGE